MPPKVSVIILNWNNYEDTRECLESLAAVTYPSYDVIVVDNASADGSLARLTGEFGQHEFIRNEENLGFAGGNNAGIRSALQHGADYVLLLNNDTIVAPGFLTEMVETAERDPTTGLVGGTVFRHGTQFVHHAGGRLSLWRATGYSYRGRNAPGKSGQREVDVGFVIGCLMLIRSGMAVDIGLLDEERFFFGGEDVEYCWRAKRAGWRIRVNLDAHIWHKVSLSSGGEASPLQFYHSTRNRLYFAHQLGVVDRLVFYAFFLMTRLGRLVQWTLSGKPELARATVWGARDYLRGVTGKGSYSPLTP